MPRPKQLKAVLALLVAAIALPCLQGVEPIKFDPEPQVLSDVYSAQGLSALGGSLVSIRSGSASNSPMSVFDATNGELLAGDLADPQALRVLEYSPGTGWAVALNESGNHQITKPNEDGFDPVALEPNRNLYVTKFIGESRDSLFVISAESNFAPRTAKVIDLSTLETTWEKEFANAPTLVLSSNRERLIVVNYGPEGFFVTTLQTFDTETGSLIETTDLSSLSLIGTNSTTGTFYHSPSGRWTFIYMPSSDRLIFADNDAGTYAEHPFGAPQVLSGDENHYVVSNEDSELEVRSTQSGATIYTLPETTEGIPVFSSANDSVYFGQTGNAAITEVEFTTGTPRATFTFPEGAGNPESIFASASGNALAALTNDDQLVVFDLQTQAGAATPLPFSDPSPGGFTTNGSAIIVPHASGQVISVVLGNPQTLLPLTRGKAALTKYSSTNHKIVTLRGVGRIFEMDLETSDETLAATIPLAEDNTIFDVSADTLRAGILDADANLSVYDPNTETTELQVTFDPQFEAFVRGALSNDGQFIAFSYYQSDGVNVTTELILYNLNEKATVQTYDSETLPIGRVFFSPDNSQLYVSGTESLAAIDVTNGSVIDTIESLAEDFVCNVSPDSEYIAIASEGLLQVIHAETGTEVKRITFSADAQAVPTSVSMSPDNNLALVVSGDYYATLIDLSRRRAVSEIPVAWSQSGSFNTGNTPRPIFYPDSRKFIHLTPGGLATLWSFEKANNVPAMLAVAANSATLSFQPVAGQFHWVESSEDLDTWQSILTLDPASETLPENVELPVAVPSDARFFRVWTYD